MASPAHTSRSAKALSVLTLAIAAFATASLTSAEEDRNWEALLRLQLEETQKCVMSGTLYVREMPAAGGTAYSGRAICLDGRMFDFSQSKPHLKFEIKSCDPTYC